MPLTADVDVVNLCLVRIAENTITDLQENSKVARVMRSVYEPSRDSLLSEYRWNFAIRRTSLAPTSGGAEFGFANKFRLPDDCLSFIGIYDENEDQRNYTSSKLPYKVEGNSLYFDGTAPQIFYVRAVTNVREFHPLFTDALAWKMAVDSAYGLSTGVDLVARADAMFDKVIRKAKAVNAIQTTPEILESTEWLDSRAAPPGPFRAGPIYW